jgi:TPR repeat protein
MAKPRYHIFLSYRREDGKDLARTIKETLTGKGYRVFLDMDELQDGVFDERILAAIDAAPIYMLLMTAHCFDRCHNTDDWVRQELEYAIRKGKTIIPINPDKQFVGYPDSMPQHLKDALKSHQYSAVDFEQLYQESMEKLITERIKPVVGFRHKALVWAIVLFFVTLVPYTVTCRYILPEYYIWKGDKILQQDSLNQADTLDAIKYYQYAIDAKNVEGYGKIGDLYDANVFFHPNWRNNMDSAIYFYKKGAYAGDAYAQCRLANEMVTDGLSINYDIDSAFYWANQAYKQKYYKAPRTLAYFYRHGLCVTRDLNKAESLYKEGIELGDIEAHHYLSLMYRWDYNEHYYVDALYHMVTAYHLGDNTAKIWLRNYKKWIFYPYVDSITEPNVRVKAMSWDTNDTLRIYCDWHNKQYQWMQIDTSAYIEDAFTGKRYTVSRLHNCKFSPDTTHVRWGHKHAFRLYFANVPDTLTRINFCESDTSNWKFYGIDISNKIHIEPLVPNTK